MKKILLIEDNKAMRENTVEILELSHYKVISASNGKEGVELAQKELPDIIICDIMMPVLDGYGVLHMLSKIEETASIPFIFLTAKVEHSDFRKGMDLGADDYLTKPFDKFELLTAIESRIKKSEILKKDYEKNMGGLNDFFNSIKGIDTLKELSETSHTEQYKGKEKVYKEGNYPRGVYFINKGKVKTYKTNEQGKEYITGLYKEGDFIGYVPLLEDEKYSDSASTLEDSEICLIPKEDFLSLIHKNAHVSRKFIKMISDNLKEKEEQLLKLAYNSVRKRVAEALATLYERYKKAGENKFTMVLSREDLANIAGTATETTIRTLSDFKDENLVEIKGGTISILNYEGLVKIKN